MRATILLCYTILELDELKKQVLGSLKEHKMRLQENNSTDKFYFLVESPINFALFPMLRKMG
jgi:hypothetical protein